MANRTTHTNLCKVCCIIRCKFYVPLPSLLNDAPAKLCNRTVANVRRKNWQVTCSGLSCRYRHLAFAPPAGCACRQGRSLDAPTNARHACNRTGRIALHMDPPRALPTRRMLHVGLGCSSGTGQPVAKSCRDTHEATIRPIHRTGDAADVAQFTRVPNPVDEWRRREGFRIVETVTPVTGFSALDCKKGA